MDATKKNDSNGRQERTAVTATKEIYQIITNVTVTKDDCSMLAVLLAATKRQIVVIAPPRQNGCDGHQRQIVSYDRYERIIVVTTATKEKGCDQGGINCGCHQHGCDRDRYVRVSIAQKSLQLSGYPEIECTRGFEGQPSSFRQETRNDVLELLFWSYRQDFIPIG